MVRHVMGVMAAAVVIGIVVLGVVSGSSSQTTATPDDAAPASQVAAETRRQQSERTTQSAAPQSSENDAADRVVTTKGADGKTYSCGVWVLDRVDAAKDRVTRREKVLKARRAAVRKLEQQYPSGEAPSEVVERYDDLVARENAQVRWTNKAIEQYNRVLRDACDPA